MALMHNKALIFDPIAANASFPKDPLRSNCSTAKRIDKAAMDLAMPALYPMLNAGTTDPGTKLWNHKSKGSATLLYGLCKKSAMTPRMTTKSLGPEGVKLPS